VSDSNSGQEVYFALWLDQMHLRENAAHIAGKGSQHFHGAGR